MTVQGLFSEGDVLTVVAFDGLSNDQFAEGCVKVLKDFDNNFLRVEFDNRYTGRSWDAGDHYFDFLVKRGYIEVFPTDGTLYL